MARRPAILERAGALTPRDRIWTAIRCFGSGGDSFSAVEVMTLAQRIRARQAAAEPIHIDTVITYVQALEEAKVLERVDAARRPVVHAHQMFDRMRLTRDTGIEAPRVRGDGENVEQGEGRRLMWNFVRKERGDFSWRDVAHRASVRRHRISEKEAKSYIRALRLAGYLQLVEPARRGRGESPERLVFRRARDTGPRAPIVTRRKEVVDGNTGGIVYDPAGEKAGGQ